MKLRPYQQEIRDKARTALKNYRNVLLQLPTGAGKTAIAGSILKTIYDKGTIGFFICHRQELISQTAKTLDKYGIDYGFIANGWPMDLSKRIFICSIDTLKNRLSTVPTPNLCIWDEAHHLRAAGWVRVHDHYSESYHIGLSATPRRLDGRGLADRFDHLITGPSVSWLISNGYLSEYKLFSIPGVERESLHVRYGHYMASELTDAMDRPSITGNILKHWKEKASDKLTIGFAVSRVMSEKYAHEFNEAGIPSAHLDGETPKGIRKDTLQRFAKGEIRVIWNIGLFGEGFDVSANSGMDVTVGCVIDAAPTMSLSAWMQRCGRALRPQDEPAVILDHAGNIKHLPPCFDREWTLDGDETTKKQKDEPEITIRQCEVCFNWLKASPRCSECGFEPEVKHREVEQVNGDLQEVDVNALRQEQAVAKTEEQLSNIEHSRGYKRGWSKHIQNARIEKKRLREELMSLSHNRIGISREDIYDLKPKALKEAIAKCREIINEV